MREGNWDHSFLTASGSQAVQADGVEIIPLVDFCNYLLEESY